MFVEEEDDQYLEDNRFQSSTPIRSYSQQYNATYTRQQQPLLQGNNNTRSQIHSQQKNPNATLRQQIEELKREISDVRLENEQLTFELNQTKEDFQELLLENKHLMQTIQEKDTINSQMKEQLVTVTKTAGFLYEKLRAFKYRYYEEQKNNAWLGGSASSDR